MVRGATLDELETLPQLNPVQGYPVHVKRIPRGAASRTGDFGL